MLHHGGPTSKRTVTYSNIPEIGQFDRGTLRQAEKVVKTSIQTVRTLDAM